MDLDSEQGGTHGDQSTVDKVAGILNAPSGEQKQDPETGQQGGDADIEKPEGGDAEQETSGRDDQSIDPDSGDDDSTAVTLAELAKFADLETRDLYGVEITVGKDETATLGELKDGYKELQKMRGDVAEFEDRKTNSQNEVMIAKRQIEQLVELGAATNSLHPQVLDKLQEIHADTVSRERRAVLGVMPEWSDEVTRAKDFGQMSDLLSKYGFSRQEVEGVLDHRLLKFARDMARRENQIKTANKGKPGQIPANTGRGKTRTSKQSKLRDRINAAKKSSNRSEKLSVITELIG
jgi:hypothetical protein